MKLEVTFTPAEFATLRQRDLSETCCVVLDILRATSTIVTALGRGAESVLPVATIEQALQCRATDASVLLAGERNGLRITAAVSGGVDFDLGNSPREFTAERVRGRRIVTTTTNGTRALTACRGARHVFAGAFLNLRHTAEQVIRSNCPEVILVCSGTGEQMALEDAMGAGAFCHHLQSAHEGVFVTDSAQVAADVFAAYVEDLEYAMHYSANARRLMAIPELADDVPFCLMQDFYPVVAATDAQGRLYRVNINQ